MSLSILTLTLSVTSLTVFIYYLCLITSKFICTNLDMTLIYLTAIRYLFLNLSHQLHSKQFINLLLQHDFSMKVLKACARVQATITYSPIYFPSSLSSQSINNQILLILFPNCIFFCFQHSILSTIPTLVSIIDNFIIKRFLSGPCIWSCISKGQTLSHLKMPLCCLPIATRLF